MASRSDFEDKFDRVDGPIGSNYTEACGQVEIFDEAVWPVEVQVDESPQELATDTKGKVQALFTGSTLDLADYSVRGVWFHIGELPGIGDVSNLITLASQDPSFTLLARMTKDPLLVDLSVGATGGSDRSFSFDPTCYDQGYGLRVTCPRDGAAPILKIVKFSPPVFGAGVSSPQTATEPDKAFVLASKTLTADELHVQVADDVTTYRDMNQEMRLRIRRADTHVILEAYLNDRAQSIPILQVVDRGIPLWGVIGAPGMEFLSATLVSQPAGTSPFTLRGIPVMACQLFEVSTLKDYRPPATTTPSNFMTYERLAERVALLIEKDGDTKFTATASLRKRLDVYLDFIYECEMGLLRAEGYWWFLRRSYEFPSVAETSEYELREDVSLVYGLTRETAPRRMIGFVTAQQESSILVDPDQLGNVRLAKLWQSEVNDRFTLQMIPTPDVADQVFRIDYYARFIRPNDPASQIPLVPQDHIDVLVYGGAAHATLHNTDAEDASSFTQMYVAKLAGLVRANNRKIQRRTVMRAAADEGDPVLNSLSPLTRAAQLSQNFFLR